MRPSELAHHAAPHSSLTNAYMNLRPQRSPRWSRTASLKSRTGGGGRWRSRDVSGTVLFTIGFEAPLIGEAQNAAEASPNETYAYNKAA